MSVSIQNICKILKLHMHILSKMKKIKKKLHLLNFLTNCFKKKPYLITKCISISTARKSNLQRVSCFFSMKLSICARICKNICMCFSSGFVFIIIKTDKEHST